MADKTPIESLSREELIALLIAQAEQIKELRRQIDELKRKGYRAAAPFSKGTLKQAPKRPGRKAGQGVFTNRTAPAPEAITTLTDVPVQAIACPCCGGALEPDGEEFVTITDIPELPKPVIAGYMIGRSRCTTCHRRVRGEHPDVAADQRGATAHRLGPRVKSTAHWLHYGIGVPQQKLPGMFKELFGLRLTQSALVQSAQEVACGSLGDVYATLREELSTTAWVHSDDTGWSIAGRQAWLMGFSNDMTVVYQIRERHRGEEVREVIPSSFDGVLITDRFRSYDAKELQGVRQQKCVAHILRNLSDHLENKHGRSRCFAIELQTIFRSALDLWHDWHAGRRKGYRARASHLQEHLGRALRMRRMRDPDNDRMLNELGRHNDRGNLLRFLDDPQIAPTNNQAERHLRPAVIARKVSHCSKTAAGSEARSVLMSVLATLKRRGVESVPDALRTTIATGIMPRVAD
jgi:transposase